MDPAEILKANVEFHRALLERYKEQPFFLPENQARVRTLLSGLAVEVGGGRLLDVGCGMGFILDLAHDLFQQLDGIDITPEMLERVTPRPNVRLRLAPAEAVPFADGAFDVITMYSVLHHLPDLAQAFREARRVLRPGGTLYADESSSRHYRDALLGLSPAASPGTILGSEIEKLTVDADLFYSRYGIDPELTRKAMAQNYAVMGLSEDNLRSVLRECGFHDIDLRFRWFCGEGTFRAQNGASAPDQIGSYLQQMLPLTRHLFKYFVLIAK